MTQLGLFPSLAEADTAGTAGMAQAADHAEAVCHDFVARARVAALARLACGPATAEELTDACLEVGIIPPDLRAFGAVYKALSRDGTMVKAGHAPRRRGHGTAGGIVWRLSPTWEMESAG